MPGTRTVRNVDARAADGPDMADAWTLVFEQLAKDVHGNYAVPALALIATCRAVCKEAMRGAAGLVTPYDATITFVPNGRARVPVRYHGGVHFAEYRYWAGLSIIRDAPSGQMFAVSHPKAVNTGECTANGKRIEEYEVHRMYPLARLAQLLGGHEANPFRRLGSLSQYECKNAVGFLGRPLRNVPMTNPVHSETREGVGLPAHDPLYGVMTKNQLRSYEWTGEPGPLQVNHEDFISQRLLRTHRAGIYMEQGDYVLSITEYKQNSGKDRVEVVALDQWLCWYGPACEPLIDTVANNWDPSHVHVLSGALGYFCEPRVAEGPGWLVSLLTHGDPSYPTALHPYLSEDSIAVMGELAREARKREDHAKALPYHPVDNPTGYRKTKKRGMRNRGKRAAAVVAQQRMLHDVPWSSSDESDHAYAPPKRRKSAARSAADYPKSQALTDAVLRFAAFMDSL